MSQSINLPAPASSWIGTENISGGLIEVCDWDIANGMDQLWQLAASGEPVFEIFRYAHCGVQIGSIEMASISSAEHKAMMGKPLQNTSVPG